MSSTVLDPAAFMAAVRRAVQLAAGKQLGPVLRRWRNTRSADNADTNLTPAVQRFLIRYGLLDAGEEELARQEVYAALLTRVGRAVGEAPGVVAAWMEAFSAGEYGWPQGAWCGEKPRCVKCPLCESCRFVASGARTSRLSGDALARGLTGTAGPAPNRTNAAELLAFLITEGKSGAGKVARAEALLANLGGVRGVLGCSMEQLRGQGLDQAAVARLRAVTELLNLWRLEQRPQGRAFTCGQDFYDHYHLRLRDLKKERCLVVCLDQKNRLLGEELVGEGGLTEVQVHPREVFGPALRLHAAAVAIVHNHPTGDPSPSEMDKALTKRLKASSELLNVRLLDHVIVGDGAYISFAERGLL